MSKTMPMPKCFKCGGTFLEEHNTATYTMFFMCKLCDNVETMRYREVYEKTQKINFLVPLSDREQIEQAIYQILCSRRYSTVDG